MKITSKNKIKILIVSLFTIIGLIVCAVLLPNTSPPLSSSNYVKYLEDTYGVEIDLVDQLGLGLPKNNETLPVNNQVKIITQGYFTDLYPEEHRANFRTRGGLVIYGTIALYQGELIMMNCESKEENTGELPCPEVKRIK